MSASLREVVWAIQSGRAALVGESAGYLVLLAADRAVGKPMLAHVDSVRLEMDGVVLLEGRSVSEAEAEQSLRSLLGGLLREVRTRVPNLERVSERRESRGLSTLILELEAALVPVNRRAAKRSLSRLARETKRAFEAHARDFAVAPVARQEVAPAVTAPPAAAPVIAPQAVPQPIAPRAPASPVAPRVTASQPVPHQPQAALPVAAPPAAFVAPVAAPYPSHASLDGGAPAVAPTGTTTPLVPAAALFAPSAAPVEAGLEERATPTLGWAEAQVIPSLVPPPARESAPVAMPVPAREPAPVPVPAQPLPRDAAPRVVSRAQLEALVVASGSLVSPVPPTSSFESPALLTPPQVNSEPEIEVWLESSDGSASLLDASSVDTNALTPGVGEWVEEEDLLTLLWQGNEVAPVAEATVEAPRAPLFPLSLEAEADEPDPSAAWLELEPDEPRRPTDVKELLARLRRETGATNGELLDGLKRLARLDLSPEAPEVEELRRVSSS